MRMYVFTVSLRQVEKKVGRVEKKSCVHCLGEISVQLPSGRAQRNLVIDYKLAQPSSHISTWLQKRYIVYSNIAKQIVDSGVVLYSKTCKFLLN